MSDRIDKQMSVRELRVTYRLRPDLPAFDGGQVLSTPRSAAGYLVPILQSEPVEVFVVVCLTAKHRVLGYREIARGAVNTVHVSSAEVFKTVLLSNAPAFMVAHSHPSGDPTPSPEDQALTRTLVAGAALFGVEMLDHIVVAGERYYSFKEGGEI